MSKETQTVQLSKKLKTRLGVWKHRASYLTNKDLNNQSTIELLLDIGDKHLDEIEVGK